MGRVVLILSKSTTEPNSEPEPKPDALAARNRPPSFLSISFHFHALRSYHILIYIIYLFIFIFFPLLFSIFNAFIVIQLIVDYSFFKNKLILWHTCLRDYDM